MMYDKFTERFGQDEMFRDIEFHKLYRKLPLYRYNEDWSNGTGQFDGAVKDRDIQFACKSQDNTGRFMVILPGRHGNIVLYKRFSSAQSSVYGIDYDARHNGHTGAGVRSNSLHLLIAEHQINDAVINELNDRIQNIEAEYLFAA